MDEAIIFKGKHEIIILPEFAPKANKLYDFLCGVFLRKGYACKFVDTTSEKAASEQISHNTKYLAGHSKGATKIVNEFKPEQFPSVEGAILFDPKQTCKDNWNGLKIRKLLFVSTVGQTNDYSGFKEKIELEDDHYFGESYGEIARILERFIR